MQVIRYFVAKVGIPGVNNRDLRVCILSVENRLLTAALYRPNACLIGIELTKANVNANLHPGFATVFPPD